MKFIYLIPRSVVLLYWKIRKPKTSGARALIIDNDKILLVKHTYLPEWYIPGGKVDKGELPAITIKRELKEELGLKANTVKLFGKYLNKKEGKIDTVYIYLIIQKINIKNLRIDKKEIENAKMFELNKLPRNTSPGTKRRINEYLGKLKKSTQW